MKDEQINELYLSLVSKVVMQRKQKMLHVSPDCENNITVDALVDSRDYVSASAQNELDTKRAKAPSKNLKIDQPPIFQK